MRTDQGGERECPETDGPNRRGQRAVLLLGPPADAKAQRLLGETYGKPPPTYIVSRAATTASDTTRSVPSQQGLMGNDLDVRRIHNSMLFFW